MRLNRITNMLAVSLLLTVLTLCFSSCTKRPEVQLTGPLPSVDELKTRLAIALQEFASLKGLARIEYNDNGNRKAADHVVFADYPDKLRLETLGLFGSPAMLAATDGTRSSVLFPGDGIAYVGPVSTDFLARVTRLPLTPEMVVSIMLRRPGLFDATEARLSHLDNGTSRLTLVDGQLAQTVDFGPSGDLVKVIYLADNRPVSVIGYSDYKNDFPGKVELELISAGINIVIRFDDIETNVELDDAIFRLVPSAGYKIEPFPEM